MTQATYDELHRGLMRALGRRFGPDITEDAIAFAFLILHEREPALDLEDGPYLYLYVTAKHEAMNLWRARKKAPLTDDGELPERAGGRDPAEIVETIDEGKRILERMRPAEVLALGLQAEGYTRDEICELAGGRTITWVNRYITEGRQRARRLREEMACPAR